jgi:hypothetical protein
VLRCIPSTLLASHMPAFGCKGSGCAVSPGSKTRAALSLS